MFNISKFSSRSLSPERRIAPRRNTHLAAEISFDKTRVPCIIRDLSDGGAKLELTRVAGIPNIILLLVPGHRPQACRVAWRAIREIGVAYLDLT